MVYDGVSHVPSHYCEPQAALEDYSCILHMFSHLSRLAEYTLGTCASGRNRTLIRGLRVPCFTIKLRRHVCLEGIAAQAILSEPRPVRENGAGTLVN